VIRFPRLALPILALALLAPAAAEAGTPTIATIDGNPLQIHVSGDGGVQVNLRGAPASEFFPQSGPSQTANNGFGIIADPQVAPIQFGKFIGSVPPPDSGPTLTPGNPAVVVTKWTFKNSSAANLIELTQTVSYTQGERQFNTRWDVKNLFDGTLSYRANVAGDLAIRGSDSGIGFNVTSPQHFMGGVNQEVGAAGGFVEMAPSWTKFESNTLSTVRTHASDATPGGGFDGTISNASSDNALGVQWDDRYFNGLPAGDTTTYTLGWRFVDTLGLSPLSATRQTGEQHAVTVSVGDVNGAPAANQAVAYEVTGVNPQKGKVKTNASGQANISWVGGGAGNDTLTAFIDANGNGFPDFGERKATATVDWTGISSPPVIGQSAGVQPVSGTVKIKLPPGTSAGKAKRLGLQGAAVRFIPLVSIRRIPLGSILETSKGTVRLFTAITKKNAAAHKFQTGNFNGGQFKVAQTKKSPLTTLSMGGGNLNSCNIGIPRGGVARKRGRRLFGNARGRFRTRGRNSSATVRGTKWSMLDTCAGTLTTVQRGSVLVRDFRLKKNKVVRAGHRYLARSFRLKKK
jgi:hypothetical protein